MSKIAASRRRRGTGRSSMPFVRSAYAIFPFFVLLGECEAHADEPTDADSCGVSGSITERIASCGTTEEHRGTAWSLVTRMASFEVWRDTSTGLFWTSPWD